MKNNKNWFVYIFFLIFIISSQTFLAQSPFNSPTTLDNSTNESQGVSFADYDKDGWIDLYITRGSSNDGSSYSNFLFNNNSGTLTKVTIGGITDIVKTSGTSTWGDYDNDGFIDLYVANAYAGSGNATPPNNFLVNDGAGSFTLNTTFGSIANDGDDSRNVGWGDYNNDGYIDLFQKRGKIGIFGQVPETNIFFSNNSGTGSTRNPAGIGNIITAGTNNIYKNLQGSFVWGDYNGDGYLDIYTARGSTKDNTLWKNDGSGAFVDTTPTELKPIPTSTSGCSWGDYNNDGILDLFTGTKPEAGTKHSFLFQNTSTTSTTTFTDVTSGEILTNEYWVQGSSFFDFDNDGDLDIFTSNRTDAVHEFPPSIVYENSGEPSYTYSQKAAIDLNDGSSDIGRGRGAAFADINNDGFLDMVVAHVGKPLQFINSASGSNKYTFVNLEGTGTTNSSAIGSRVYVTANIPEQNGSTEQMREVSGQTGGGGQNSLRQHFGIGTTSKIDEIRAEWLNSTGGSAKTVNSMTDLPANKYYYFKEGNLSVTSDIIEEQNFVYLFGNTKSAIEFTTNTDTDGGTLTAQKFESDPDGTYDGGSATSPDGGTVTPNAVVDDRYWSITESSLTGNFTTTVYFDASSLPGGVSVDDITILKRTNSGSDWTALNTSKIGNTVYATGITSFSEFGLGYEASGVLLETKIFMEGPYNTGTNEMTTSLNPADIPTTSPYADDARTVGSVPANVVDWILVQLRTTTDSSSTVISKSVFLHSDGRIVADDGTTGQIELDAPAGSYYIVIKHRNHLSVMSAGTEVLNSSTSTLYNFTTGSDKYFGTNGAKQIGN